MKSMECGLGFQDLVHNFGHFITSVLHNFGSALYQDIQFILIIASDMCQVSLKSQYLI